MNESRDQHIQLGVRLVFEFEKVFLGDGRLEEGLLLGHIESEARWRLVFVHDQGGRSGSESMKGHMIDVGRDSPSQHIVDGSVVVAELDGVSHLIDGGFLDVGEAPEGAVGQHPVVLFNGSIFDGFCVLGKVVREERLDDELVGEVGFPSGGEVHDGIVVGSCVGYCIKIRN